MANENELKCQYCDRVFSNRQNLRAHQKKASYCITIQEERKAILQEETHIQQEITELRLLSEQKDAEISKLLEQKDAEISKLLEQKDAEMCKLLEKKDAEMSKLETVLMQRCRDM